MQVKQDDSRFACLGSPRRIWAVSAVHAEIGQLMQLHDAIFPHIRPGDRLLYLGNYLGFGKHPVETVDELLTFRRSVMAIPGMMAGDVIYLRGGQEEMWQKLMQVQFAPNPSEILLWMLSKGLSNTLVSYGIDPHEGVKAAGEGTMPLTRWTNKVREAVRRHPGHETFSTQWRRAAYTVDRREAPLLFVNAGINPARALEEQGDCFWWAGQNFNAITAPYNPFSKVIRGYDPAHGGVNLNCVTATIDGGCGFGGELVCAGFTNEGEIFDMVCV